MEQRYEEHIKSIHDAIIAYSFEIQLADRPGLSARLHEYRTAGRSILEAVKAMKHLNKNLQVSVNHYNADIREQYDMIRRQIVQVLRTVDAFKEPLDDTSSGLSLDAERAKLENASLFSESRLGELLRAHRLSAPMIGSMLKDEGYSKLLCSKMLFAASVILGSTDEATRKFEQAITLTEEELQGVVQEQAART